MGSTDDIRWMQSWCLGLFCCMLCIVPCSLSETQEIRYLVSRRRHRPLGQGLGGSDQGLHII